jgi:hypothetical protein
MTTQRVTAADLMAEDSIPGLDNAYIVEVETGDGYLSYPRTASGYSAAMPEDTILVTYHDANGNENYMLLNPDAELIIERN